MSNLAPICMKCHRPPWDIPECRAMARDFQVTPDVFVRENDGTYNPASGLFACDTCYIKMGQPSSPRGWKAP